MSEKLNQNTNPKSKGVSGRARKRGLLFRRRLAVALILLFAIAAGVVYALVANYVSNLPVSFVDPNDGVEYEIRKGNGVFALYTLDGEMCRITDDGYFVTEYGTLVYISQKTGEYSVDQNRELIYESLEYNAYSSNGSFLSGCNEKNTIKRIDVYNDKGHYAFVRNDKNNFIIEGRELVAYDTESFAELAVACGYTLSLLKLESPKLRDDGSINYAEYGLSHEIRTKTETDENGNEVEVEYEYSPAKYTVTTMNGDTYTVYLGDLAVTGNAYYARYESEQKTGVYLLSRSGRDYITQSIEAIVTPQLVYRVGEVEYVDVEDFIIRSNIDYEAIHDGIVQRFGEDYDLGKMTEAEREEYRKLYDELYEKHSRKVCHISYQDLEERKNSLYSAVPYISYLELERGYYLNADNVSKMLGKIYDTDFEGVLKLSPTEQELNDYGVMFPETVISFYYIQYDNDGKESLIFNQFYISKQLSDGTYNAYSDSYDMIVNISRGCFDFLSWKESDWYSKNYIQHSIGHITNIKVETPNTNVDFVFDDSQTLAGSIIPSVGSSFTDSKKNEYKVQKIDGKFKLTAAGLPLEAGYTSDYLVTATPYYKINPQNEGYLFAEVTPADSDGDGNNDIYIYYYYQRRYKDGKYILSATTATTLPDGTPVTQGAVVDGTPSLTTEYFVTSTLTSYVYYAPRTSALGKKIDQLYADHSEYTDDRVRVGGVWHTGSVYKSAKGMYIIMDSETGEWAQVENLQNGLHIADRMTSALASSAYISDSRADLPEERFYPLKDGVLSYNYDEKRLEFYDRVTKTKRAAKTSDCAPGIWCDGDMYVTGSGQMVAVDSQGDISKMVFDESTEFIAKVYANSKPLDYLIYTTETTGASKTVTATANFQQFYLGLLYASLEGECELTPEEMAALRKLDSFTEAGDDSPCMLRLTVSAKDFKGNEHTVVYRFYRISERRAYITLEWIEGGEASSSERASGSFYVLASFVDKMVSDAQKVVDGELVSASGKY